MNAKQVFDLLKQEHGDGGGGDGFDEHDWDGAKELTEDEKKKLERDIDQAMRQGVMAHQKLVGKGTGGLSRELQDLLEPKIDWREVLREFVKSTCRAKDTSSWRRPNRRYLSTGTYMPSMIGERVGHLVVAVDTSGSIGDAELAEFLSEVKGIAEEVNPEKVDLLYWDSEVAAHEEYNDADVPNIVSSTKPAGGGGTSPSCVSAYIAEKKIEPECIIVLTDGCVGNDWGKDWNAPLLWVITGGNRVMAEIGKTIHVER
jgi:predicted metal-dependent peptidase